MSEIDEWGTEFILSECREQMQSSAGRGYYVDELKLRLEMLKDESDQKVDVMRRAMEVANDLYANSGELVEVKRAHKEISEILGAWLP